MQDIRHRLHQVASIEHIADIGRSIRRRFTSPVISTFIPFSGLNFKVIGSRTEHGGLDPTFIILQCKINMPTRMNLNIR